MLRYVWTNFRKDLRGKVRMLPFPLLTTFYGVDEMPRKCTVCEHEKVEEINRLLLEGVSLRNLAKQYFVSAASLHRHKKDHLPAKLVKAREAREIAKADSLLDQVSNYGTRPFLSLTKQSRPATCGRPCRE
jgi:hypothetical protein